MKERYYEVQGFKTVSGTFLFVEMKKISNQNHAVCCSRSILFTIFFTRVGLCSCVCLGDEKLYSYTLYA